MPSPSLATLASAIPAQAIQGIASQFGSSESSVLNGLQSSIASVVGGLAQKAGDSGFLGQIMKSAADTLEPVDVSAVKPPADETSEPTPINCNK